VNRETALKLGGIRTIGTRRNLILMVVGLCAILGSVELLNLQKSHVSVERRTELPSVTTAAPEKAAIGHSATAPSAEIAPSSSEPGTVTNSDLDYLASRDLLIPLKGITANQLRDTYNEARSEGRQHNALDIKAAQGTAVLATTDGVVIKLFQSERGGITLYQLDPSGHFAYYYAHLMRYEDGIAEGKKLRRGDVIAYVGDTGNAGPGNYHLHFGISKLTAPGKWSGGDPINPFPLLVNKR
jgi:murein DD-endopeptidase MepM/ murein hydrolase activator NlpD